MSDLDEEAALAEEVEAAAFLFQCQGDLNRRYAG